MELGSGLVPPWFVQCLHGIWAIVTSRWLCSGVVSSEACLVCSFTAEAKDFASNGSSEYEESSNPVCFGQQIQVGLCFWFAFALG